MLCPCGNKESYEKCCGVFISEKALPETPEQLMRSRYTAYTQGNVDYIASTMKGPAAKNFNKQSAKAWACSVQWIGLTVLSTKNSSHENLGYVEFVAVFRSLEKIEKIHESSEFHRIGGRWYYWSGVHQ